VMEKFELMAVTGGKKYATVQHGDNERFHIYTNTGLICSSFAQIRLLALSSPLRPSSLKWSGTSTNYADSAFITIPTMCMMQGIDKQYSFVPNRPGIYRRNAGGDQSGL